MWLLFGAGYHTGVAIYRLCSWREVFSLCFQRLVPFPSLFSSVLPWMCFPSANTAFLPLHTPWSWKQVKVLWKDWMESRLLTEADRAEQLPMLRGCRLLCATPALTSQRGPMLPRRADPPGHPVHRPRGLAGPPAFLLQHRPSRSSSPPGYPACRPGGLAGPLALLLQQPWQVCHGTWIESCWGPPLWVTAETGSESSPPRMSIWRWKEKRRHIGVLSAREGGGPLCSQHSCWWWWWSVDCRRAQLWSTAATCRSPPNICFRSSWNQA